MEDMYAVKKSDLVGIADAIRSKTGSTDTIGIDEMKSQIESIPSGGGASDSVWNVDDHIAVSFEEVE